MQKPSRSSKIFIALLFLFVIVATLLAAASVNLLVIVVLSKLYPDDVSVGGAMSGMVFSIGMLFIFRLFILAGSLFELGTQIWFKRSLFWRGLVNAGLCYGFTWLYIILLAGAVQGIHFSLFGTALYALLYTLLFELIELAAPRRLRWRKNNYRQSESHLRDSFFEKNLLDFFLFFHL
ncbi:hypothetical protein P7H20_20060 [Paenibacillus larvae]|nr:hypothetical protein [Paenibacillus larvae]MDT2242000.1 hypothetical protein [Paenibacillus larvae]MDT2264158.1 hypothetical protein [Paenibacillus larvae]MDT2276655.1 hypothetical protein [Paenibacillus larvae]